MAVNVKSSARIHMGFFDLNGQHGRRFGSIGLSLDRPNTIIRVEKGFPSQHQVVYPEYVERILNKLNLLLPQEASYRVQLIEEIPRHSGLGSGTQMALSLGVGISHLFDCSLDLNEIAAISGRGKRSGIGIGTFRTGGFIVDGGRGLHTKIPPIIAHGDFPSNWRVLLVYDQAYIGLHGEAEKNAFKTLSDAPKSATDILAHQILLKLIPAIHEHDFKVFAEGVTALQDYNGQYFSPAQGGTFASEAVANVLQELKHHEGICVGQSSWGPTGFAIFEKEALAISWKTILEQRFQSTPLRFELCGVINTGAQVIEEIDTES